MISAYNIDGDSYKFRFGVKAPDENLLKMPRLTEPFGWPSAEDIKRTYPCEADAIDGQWCWTEHSR